MLYFAPPSRHPLAFSSFLRIDHLLFSLSDTSWIFYPSDSGNTEGLKLAAIDEDDIWEIEVVLAKWKQGKRVLCLVEWRARGFFDEANSWEKQRDISIDKFGTAYSKCGGNYVGVELLDKRIQPGRAETS